MLVNGAEQVWIDRGAGPGADRRQVPRRAGRAPTRPAPGCVRGPTTRRRLAVRRPASRRRLPLPRRAGPGLAAGHAPVPEGPSLRVFTLAELVAAGTVTTSGAELLEQVVRRRLAFLVSGGTGSGKTTLLNALLSLVPAGERLVLVEDASELRPEHPPRGRAGSAPAQHRGSGRDHPAHPGPAGTADAPRPAGRRRGARRRGGRHAGGDEHRARRRLRHGARELRRRRAEPDRGAGARRRHDRARRPTASCSPRSTWSIHLERGPDGRRRVQEIGVVTRTSVEVEVVTGVRFAHDGALLPGPALDALAALVEP